MAVLKKENLRLEWCKGCGYCVEACNKKALKIGRVPNKQGYLYIDLDEAECIGCGLCRLVCPDSVFVFTEA